MWDTNVFIDSFSALNRFRLVHCFLCEGALVAAGLTGPTASSAEGSSFFFTIINCFCTNFYRPNNERSSLFAIFDELPYPSVDSHPWGILSAFAIASLQP